MAQLARLALSAALLVAPTIAFGQAPVETAHIDVLQGRTVLLGGGSDAETIRRGETMVAKGRSQMEVSAGSQARISWRGTASIHIWGPASLEWSSHDGSLNLTFHELAWADVEARSGQHTLTLPANWHARFGRSSFHLRGLSGGPSELRHHAGNAIILDWRGDEASLRPPMAVYPGSSVRLDRPRYQRTEVADRRTRGAWTERETRDEVEAWPWRERADDDRQVAERATLSRETQTLDALPGTPVSQITRVRTYQTDGSSNVAPIRRRRTSESSPSGVETYAQAPVVPVRPRIEVEPRPLTRRSAPLSSAQSRSAAPSRIEQAPATRSAARLSAPASRFGDSNSSAARTRSTARELTAGPAPGRSMDLERGQDSSSSDRASRAVRQRAYSFDSLHWRGLDITDINGTGEIAAERASGVEVRVLGQGRSKVFVSSGAPGPRWCFTPTMDLLMYPGSVAVFEADGTLRMNFGKTEENEPIAGRPSYADLAD